MRIPTRTVAEGFLAALKARGVDYFFANAGTDFASIVEALSTPGRKGRFPEAIAVPHENAAVGMAHGYTMVTGRPQAVMVHVNVGTANAINGLINAASDYVPMLMCAGRTPLFEEGHLGARNVPIHWAQEMFDQAAMVREVVKWDYELRDAAQVATVVDRALAIATAAPQGPVYLSMPREVLAREMKGLSLPDEMRTGVSGDAQPDPDIVARAADILAKAERPLIITAASGQDPATVKQLAGLAERFALPVVEFRSRFLCLPSDHPMHIGYEFNPHVGEADAVLVLDCDVPWMPVFGQPKPETPVIQVGSDPLFQGAPVRSFPADLAIAAPTRTVLPKLARALAGRTKGRAGAIDRRRRRIAAQHATYRKEAVTQASKSLETGQISFGWVSLCLDRLKGPDDILVSEYSAQRQVLTFTRPGTFFQTSQAGGLGWGLPAALGAKLAAPERQVIAVLGDGAYMFANPVACHQVAEAMDLPVLTVINNNSRWAAVERAVNAIHPGGHASRRNRVPLASLEPSPDFAKVIEASGGHGERVERPEDLPDALARAMRIVKDERRQALVDVRCV
ncbi:MAG: thiamine pyrophosphate-requiring protein [Alphaproteobacteria bacterium]|jgi:acetolactate synthase-1/2/3 large subunit|nr:thiamine pyrophosphate-requiring protein [Alphaproteobacteria bacterium]